jgi:hypothetical protein
VVDRDVLAAQETRCGSSTGATIHYVPSTATSPDDHRAAARLGSGDRRFELLVATTPMRLHRGRPRAGRRGTVHRGTSGSLAAARLDAPATEAST